MESGALSGAIISGLLPSGDQTTNSPSMERDGSHLPEQRRPIALDAPGTVSPHVSIASITSRIDGYASGARRKRQRGCPSQRAGRAGQPQRATRVRWRHLPEHLITMLAISSTNSAEKLDLARFEKGGNRLRQLEWSPTGSLGAFADISESRSLAHHAFVDISGPNVQVFLPDGVRYSSSAQRLATSDLNASAAWVGSQSGLSRS